MRPFGGAAKGSQCLGYACIVIVPIICFSFDVGSSRYSVFSPGASSNAAGMDVVAPNSRMVIGR